MSKVKGGRLMVMLGNPAKSVSYATNHTLSINAELTDVSNKDENNSVSGATWQAQEANIMSWEASTENLYSMDGKGKNFADLYDYMVAGQPIDLILALADEQVDNVPASGWTGDTDTVYYKGKALVSSLQLNAPNGENANYTANFTGVSKLEKVTPA